MWNMKSMIITITTGATRIVTTALKKKFKSISGKH
jgi:hypothetical protein